MRRKHYPSFTLIIFLCISSADAQVTIGAGSEPSRGSLLQLKEKNEAGENASKGLGLPRVTLTDLVPTTAADLAASINGQGEYDMEEHIGLVIYNVNRIETATKRICPGIHVWTGTKWEPLFKYPPVFTEIKEFMEGAGPAEPLVDVRNNGSEQNRYNTVHFKGVKITELGNEYACDPADWPKFIKYDAGIWTAENMNTKYFPDTNREIPNQAIVGASYDEPRFFYAQPDRNPAFSDPADIPNYDKAYGMLYNWKAVMNGQTTSGYYEYAQGLCPKGWHVPSHMEWLELRDALEASASIYSDETDGFGGGSVNDLIGRALKSKRELPDHVHGAPGGTSKEASAGGFDALLTGSGDGNLQNKLVNGFGNTAYFWSSSSVADEAAVYYILSNSNFRWFPNYTSTSYSFGVRCKKDK